MSVANPSQRATYSGLARRFAALSYDALLLLGVLFFASIPFTLITHITYDSPWYPLYAAYICGVTCLFFGWFWTHGGQTLGMKTWQVRLATADGKALDWGRALRRCLWAFLPWLPLAIAGWTQRTIETTSSLTILLWLPPIVAWLTVLTNRAGVTWYDHWSGTRLIYEKRQG